jgi:hypothetical protein
MIFDACLSNDKKDEIIKVNAEELINEFENDCIISINKYKGKFIQISGKVVEKGSPKDKVPPKNASYIVFGRVNQEGSLYFTGNTVIVCYFDKVVVNDLKVDEIITVQCKFKDYGSSYGEMKRINFVKGVVSKNYQP